RITNVEGVDHAVAQGCHDRGRDIDPEISECRRDPREEADCVGRVDFDDGRRRGRVLVDGDRHLATERTAGASAISAHPCPQRLFELDVTLECAGEEGGGVVERGSTREPTEAIDAVEY